MDVSGADGRRPRGAVSTEGGDVAGFPRPAVTAVDTTGAGDTFAGYLAASLALGHSLGRSAARAVRAGALAVTREGAQPAIPVAGEVDPADTAPGGSA